MLLDFHNEHGSCFIWKPIFIYDGRVVPSTCHGLAGPSQIGLAVSSPPEPAFSHDLTLKSLFAERDMVRDLIRYHASILFPELQGFEPTELAASSTVTTDPVAPPHQQGRDRDLVWTLARAAAREDRVLLHLEFQSQPDATMTLRMVDYAHGLFQRYPEREVCGLVVNTGSRPFGSWWCPVQTVAGTRGYGFQPGPVLDVHDFPLPVFPDARYPLSADSLMTGFITLARIQLEMRRNNRAAVDQILPVLRTWIVPLVLRSTETLRRAFGAWFRTAFGELLGDDPELRAELSKIVYIEDAEAVMYTISQALEDRFKQGEAQGEARATRHLLLQFVAEAWGDAEAERFAKQLEGTEPDRMPSLRDLMADQRAGRPPRLHHNGRTASAE